jgi:hypothetical protein
MTDKAQREMTVAEMYEARYTWHDIDRIIAGRIEAARTPPPAMRAECHTITAEYKPDKYDQDRPIIIGIERVPSRNLFSISEIEARSLIEQLGQALAKHRATGSR